MGSPGAASLTTDDKLLPLPSKAATYPVSSGPRPPWEHPQVLQQGWAVEQHATGTLPFAPTHRHPWHGHELVNTVCCVLTISSEELFLDQLVWVKRKRRTRFLTLTL